MPQTSIKYLMDLGFEGMIGDTNPRVIRGAIEKFKSGATPIPYGRIVVRSSPGSSILTLPSAAGQKPVGIAIATDMYGYQEQKMIDGTVEPGYPANVMINVLTWGDVLMYATEVVNPDDPATFLHTAGAQAYQKVGRVGKTAGATADLYSGVKFLTGTAVPGLVWVAVNIP